MKPLWTIILLICTSAATCQNMTGIFYNDWQNTVQETCAPDSFTITEISNNTYQASYAYSLVTVDKYCKYITNFTGNYTANLTQGANDSWIDAEGQKLIYDQPNDVFYFVSNKTGDSFLYDRNSSYIPMEFALGNIGGNWSNPTPLNSSTDYCCVPDGLFITIDSIEYGDAGNIFIAKNYTTDCYDSTLSPAASIYAPGVQNITWTSFGATVDILSDYIFDPYNANQLTVILNDNNNSCWYTYDKIPNHNLLSNTWHLDWQSDNAQNVPQTYTISILNGSIMEGTLLFTSDTDISFVVGNGQNLFFDSAMQLTFAYDNSSNTLMSFPSSSSPSPILYSPTGSIVSQSLNYSNWNNPQVYNKDDGNCCVPDSILISPSSSRNILLVTYTFSSDDVCDSVAPYVTPKYQLESTLNITTPNVNLVTWTDELYSTQISFPNASTTSEILVSNFTGSGCSFTMTSAPLSGSWMSLEITSLVVLCLLLFLGNI